MEQFYSIADMIIGNGMILYGQPKWTFGKNTCNTYELFVDRVRTSQGETIPAWPIVNLIEKDPSLTMLFSNWLLWHAMEETARLNKNLDSHLTLSLNLLPSFAESMNFVQQVQKCLEEFNIEPKHFQFELSESQVLTEKGIENLNYLHDEVGIGVLLANFGTENSNVKLLREVHFSGLELDKSYAPLVVSDEHAAKFVIAVQNMAHTMDMFVCAKGIETMEQFEFFEDIGVMKGQGYLIAHPMPLDDLEDYIKKYALKR